MNCDPKELANAARCFETCIPPGMQAAVQNYLLCQVAELAESIQLAQSNQAICERLLFASIADAGPSLTTDETSLIGPGVGSIIIPANSVEVGTTFRVNARGTWARSNGASSGSIDLVTFGLNASSFVSGGIPVVLSNDLCWLNFELFFTFRAIGVAGKAASTISACLAGTWEPGEIIENGGTNPITVNTTIPQTLFATMVLNSDADKYTCINFTFERLN